MKVETKILFIRKKQQQKQTKRKKSILQNVTKVPTSRHR